MLEQTRDRIRTILAVAAAATVLSACGEDALGTYGLHI